MGNPERQPKMRRGTDSDSSAAEGLDSHSGGNIRRQDDGPFIRELVPGVQREINQALERVIFLLARVSRDRQALERVRANLDQSLDLLTEQILDIAWLFGLTVTDLDEGDLEQAEEALDPRHFYAAYVFDQAHERKDDVSTLVEQAQELGYPMRYWWLSQSVELRDHPDRLIVCVHHPSLESDAGMDLYKTLKEQQIAWDDLESAAVEEYRLLGKPIEGPAVICGPDGTPLFPSAAKDPLE